MAPDALPEPILVAALIADTLSRIGVRYVIGGSFASSIHGDPRSTNDIDIVADLHLAEIDAFTASVRRDFYVSREAAIEAVRTGGAFNIIHTVTAVKVDIFVVGADPFDRERLSRSTPVRLSAGSSNVELFVDTPEDTILRKLEWYRRGGESSERQWRDIIGVAHAQSSRLDGTYLRTWAGKLGVADLLERAIASSGF